MPSINEYDAALASMTPPAPPAAQGPQLAADAAAAVAEILADRAAIDAEFVTLRADNDAAVADLATQIAETISETTATVADTRNRATAALTAEKSQAAATLADAMDDADPDDFRAIVQAARRVAEEYFATAAHRTSEALTKANDAKDNAVEVLGQLDEAAEKIKTRVDVMSGGNRSTRDFEWHLYGQQQANTLLPNVPDPGPIASYVLAGTGLTFGIDALNGGIDEVNRLYTVWNNSSQDGFLSRIYQVVGTGVYDVTGGTNIYRAATGGDFVTLEQYSTGQRWLQGGIGVIKFAGVAARSAQGLNNVRGFLSGPKALGGGCFVAGTPVHISKQSHVILAGASPPSSASDPDAAAGWPLLGIVSAVAGAGTVGVLERRRRKRASQQMIDELFEENDLDELWGTTPLSQSVRRHERELVEV